MVDKSISDTSVLLFSSKDDNPGEVLYNMKSGDNKDPTPENKSPLPAKIAISTRDGPIATNTENFVRFNNVAWEEGQTIWLDFRSGEVHDFLDVIAGRKHYLCKSEHVEAIASALKIDLKIIDDEYDKLADLIRETIIIDIYRIFPAGRITDLNKSLIYVITHPHARICRLPGISLKNTISKNVREQIKKLSRFSQDYVWKRVNDSGIPLKRRNGSSIMVQLMTDQNFSEYWLIFRPS